MNEEFVTLEELLFVIQQEYPYLVGGKDYLLARALNPDGTPKEHARVDEWPEGIDKPDADWIQAHAAIYKKAFQESQARSRRDQLLAQTDWTQAADVPPETSARFAEYRQALRDITNQPGWPLDVVWPELPK
ncbi:phage tail assembly chaperone [Burkholderia multivorans]|uniref:tail fiber assembly protein n=1 Tax=Burkholderia multivorans TaxID=87883 RepID=UPI001C275C82|nr:tail fiber assembly protein [Burkholderia multivorans]MBU9376290.1 phage tail assembly chaperone [Burkholderia multivorans]MBU9528221.1 phage tail assembly chaperone [Burkholderia multivorans]